MDARAALPGLWQLVRRHPDLGRHPDEAGHVPSQSNGLAAFGLLLPALFSLERDLVFSWQYRGCWEGKTEPASFLVELEAWGKDAFVLWGPLPPCHQANGFHEGEPCQVTCRGQHEPEAPISHLTRQSAGGHSESLVPE